MLTEIVKLVKKKKKKKRVPLFTLNIHHNGCRLNVNYLVIDQLSWGTFALKGFLGFCFSHKTATNQQVGYIILTVTYFKTHQKDP